MAFLDDISKKLDVARVNGLIGEEEKKMNSNYFQIGKLYVAMHSNDYEPDFDYMISALKESEARIEEYKKQIKELKGVEYCTKCGAEVAAGVAFCSNCGASMPRRDPEGEISIKCPDCGQIIKKDMRFCTGCGRPTYTIK